MTVWPIIYMFLFLGSIFSMVLLAPFAEKDSGPRCGEIDILQLDDKIKAGEIKELRVERSKIEAFDSAGNCSYRVYVSNDATRERIIRTAQETNANGSPRVAKISQDTSEPQLPALAGVGIVTLFAAHFLTILLMLGLMPLYIVLAVKDERHDQTTRIIWVVLFCTVNMFAMPVYWYLYLWRQPRPPNTPLPNSP